MKRSSLDKRSFYSQPEISDTYDEQRFGGASGARVNQREIDIVLRMLPPIGRVLDLACGTGRVTFAVAQRGQPVVALDYSSPMAQKVAAAGIPTVVADGFATPFATASFDAVISIRFGFHWPDLRPLLAEMRRVTVPGGTLVLDTYSWTPRAALALGSARWGGKVHLHSRQEVSLLAAAEGLRVVDIHPCFLFSPYLYRLAPLPMERMLEKIETAVPRSWLCRVFWKLTVPA